MIHVYIGLDILIICGSVYTTPRGYAYFFFRGGWGGSFFSWLLPLLIVRAEGSLCRLQMNGDPKGIGAGRDTTGSSGPKLGGVGGAQRGLRHRKGRGGAKQKSFIPEQKWGRPLPPPQSPGAELGGRADAHPGGVGERRREPKTQPGVPQNPELTALGRCAPQDGDGVGLGDGGGGCPRLSDAPTWGLHCTSGPGSAERTRRWRGVRVGVGAATRSASG